MVSRETNERIRSSFRCTPDPSKDLDAPVVAVEKRKGWYRTKQRPPGGIMLANGSDVLVQMNSLADLGSSIDIVMASALKSGGFEVVADPAPRGGKRWWRGTLKMKRGPVPAAVAAWPCATRQAFGVVYVTSLGNAPMDPGLDLAATARCLAPGEAAPDYPDALR
jgi:hypothetical protein